MALDAVPADYVVEDFRELLALNPVLHGGIGDEQRTLILGSLQNPDGMQQLADRLNERMTGSNDVLILYVAAHGLTQDGDAWLLASGSRHRWADDIAWRACWHSFASAGRRPRFCYSMRGGWNTIRCGACWKTIFRRGSWSRSSN